MTRIPFELPDVGLREIKGLLSTEDEFLVLELENAFLGEWDKDYETVKIELGALEEVRIEQRVARVWLVLRPKRADLLRALPGKHVREVRLKMWRTRYRALRELVRQIEYRVG